METNANDDINQIVSHIQRMNNEEIQNVFRRILSLRGTNLTEINDLQNFLRGPNILEMILSNQVFLISPFIIIFLLVLLYVHFMEIITTNEISVKILELEEMWSIYAICFVIATITLWNFYLLIFHTLINFENFKFKSFDVSTADVLYFNPMYFSIFILHVNKTYISTSVDLFLIMTFSMFFFINLFYTVYSYSYFKLKINSISNLHLAENRILLYKMRFFNSFLICMNIFEIYLISFTTENGDIFLSYLMNFKAVYLILRITLMWYENENSYKQLDNSYVTNGENYLRYQRNKSALQIICLVNYILKIDRLLYFKNYF